MSNTTTNFNLVQPEKTDPAAISVLNGDLGIIDEEMAKPPLTINGILPDPVTRNTTVNEVPLAGNLATDEAQDVFGTFTERTSGGTASIADGSAWLVTVKGNSVKTGVVQEELSYEITSDDVTVTTFDEDTFKSVVTESGTTTLTFTSSWSADPATYGFTLAGTPANGDTIVITYVKGNRGVITSANPTTFNSTGWNLFNYDTGYAKVVQYSAQYGFVIAGTYSLLEFATTVNGTRSTIVPVEGAFNIPSDGYVFVTGGNQTDTAIYMTWSDWTDPDNVPAFATYTVDQISLAAVMVNFPAGLMSVGEVRDEINLNTQRAISRIERLAYTDANLAYAEDSGRPYDTDTDYIYLVRETPVPTVIDVDGSYAVSDHGIEFFLGTPVACVAETLYGQDLKGKLRRDVVTISAQELTASDQAQVRTNIGAASASDVTTLQTSVAGKQDALSVSSKTYTANKGVTCKVRKYGAVVNMVISGTATGTISANETIFTLETAHRPAIAFEMMGTLSNSITAVFAVTTGGVVTCKSAINSSGNTYPRLCASYVGSV